MSVSVHDELLSACMAFVDSATSYRCTVDLADDDRVEENAATAKTWEKIDDVRFDADRLCAAFRKAQKAVCGVRAARLAESIQTAIDKALACPELGARKPEHPQDAREGEAEDAG